MNKLLKVFDTYFLKFGVAFAMLFVAWYPKVPSIHVPQTWVYIRLEDFVILTLALAWLILFIRKKVTVPKPEGFTIIGYWIVGLVSLLYCLAFVAPDLVNFFPKIAFFQYVRRIEYMILFFIAFSTIKQVKDVYFYLITLCVTISGVVLYGFGQRFYFLLWHAFPDFFQKYQFCFPAFLTGNEEFAKGIPLCLNDTSRITSTFGGHYDLSAYMVFVIPILIALAFSVKKVSYRIFLVLLGIFSLELLNFTSSRTSFGAYVIGVVAMLILWHKKKWILPILALSIGVMLLFGNSTIQRFSKTVQQVQVVSTNQELPSDLQKIIAQAKDNENNKKPETPPPGDLTVGRTPMEPQQGYSTVLTQEQLDKIRSGDIAISSVSGSFLISKAYALDMSFTTRFQAEWPRNWRAFLASPIFGTGYSSLTLATDNDYLRALGETGLSGLVAFLFIFVVLGIFAKNAVKHVNDPVLKGFIYGLCGGMIGLLVNAVLIDVFEASKVAESLWILLGIGVGGAKLFVKEPLDYKKALFAFFSSRIMISIYLLLSIIIVYGASITNFFVADDFTWLRWAASATSGDLLSYFVNSEDFFYRPFTKIATYYLYSLFSFQPQGYHIVNLSLHVLVTIGIFLLAEKIVKRRLLSFVIAFLFAIHPVHTENVFWFSTLSSNMSNLFMTYSLLFFILFKERKSWYLYGVSLLLSVCAFFSYEISVILPLLILFTGFWLYNMKFQKRSLMTYFPYILLLVGYFILRYFAHAFTGGGDYAYNIAKIIPNSIGNLFGYMGLSVGGMIFLPFYDTTRELLRTHWLIISILCIGVSIITFLYGYKKRLFSSMLTSQKGHTILYGFGIAFISLIPFLPLGNVGTRYAYLASFGFILSFVVGLWVLITYLVRSKKYRIFWLVICTVVMVGLYYPQNVKELQKWRTAGNITKKTLAFFRLNYASFSKQTKVYVVHIPVQYNGVWVFPVGLVDGLWFIYRDNTPQVYDRASIEESRAAKKLMPENTYIYQFKEGVIGEIK